MFRERLQEILKKAFKRYIVVIYSENSLGHKATYTITPLRGLLLIISVAIGIILFSYLVFAFTPLKNFIPGNNRSLGGQRYIELQHRVDTLQKQVEAQRQTEESLREILRGNSDSTGSKQAF